MELADIMEARIEEIFELAINEIRQMGIYDLREDMFYGRVASTQGIPELAQAVFQNRVRVAAPDYIGVREPQYTTAVGLIKFAYKNAKVQGRILGSSVAANESSGKHTQKLAHQTAKKEKPTEERLSVRVKRFFGYFFE